MASHARAVVLHEGENEHADHEAGKDDVEDVGGLAGGDQVHDLEGTDHNHTADDGQAATAPVRFIVMAHTHFTNILFNYYELF